MNKLFVLITIFAMMLMTPVAFAQTVTCPLHTYASCYNTGQTKTGTDGTIYDIYHCSCNDDVLVRWSR